MAFYSELRSFARLCVLLDDVFRQRNAVLAEYHLDEREFLALKRGWQERVQADTTGQLAELYIDYYSKERDILRASRSARDRERPALDARFLNEDAQTFREEAAHVALSGASGEAPAVNRVSLPKPEATATPIPVAAQELAVPTFLKQGPTGSSIPSSGRENLSSTVGVDARMAQRPVVPFVAAPASASPVAAPSTQSPVPRGLSTGTVAFNKVTPKRPTLPFARVPARPQAPELRPSAPPSTPQPTTPSEPAASSLNHPIGGNGVPILSLEHYAALCAEIEASPERINETAAKYQIHTADALQKVHETWQIRLAGDRGLQQRFRQCYAYYGAWASRQKSPTSAPAPQGKV